MTSPNIVPIENKDTFVASNITIQGKEDELGAEKH